MSPTSTTGYAYRFAVHAVVTILGVGAVAVGVLLILGGPAQFASPSLVIARAVPYSPYSWGAVLASSGAASMLGAAFQRPRLMRAALFGQAVWYLFLVLTLLAVAVTGHAVPVTGSIAYVQLGALSLVAWGAAREMSRPPRTDPTA
jgi:hypothetical protein